jgi:peroxiredoxin
MKTLSRMSMAVSAAAFSFVVAANAQAAKVGDSAPSFTVTDSQGKTQSLDAYKGKYVVLEWHNEGCPYVKKFYQSGAMQKMQKEWTGKGVAWLVVDSSAPGSQGFADAKTANEDMTKHNATPTAVLLDAKGDVAQAYGAKTTPHMFVINPDGKLIYNGAIDDKATTESSDIAGAKNYVAQALTESMAGKSVSTTSTQPYGCSVKYSK